MAARRKYMETQMEEDWGGGMARLFNPPPDFIPLVVRKIEAERAAGVLVVPTWNAQPWYARLAGLASRMTRLEPGGRRLWDGREGKAGNWGMTIAEIGCGRSGLQG